jgi:hypothetical protein
MPQDVGKEICMNLKCSGRKLSGLRYIKKLFPAILPGIVIKRK